MTFEQLMDCHQGNRQVYENLLDQMKKNRVMPFLGSGMSSWAYPMWSSLLYDLAKGCGKDFKNQLQALLEGDEPDRYESAAALIESELGKGTFYNKISAIFASDILSKKQSCRPDYQRHLPEIFKGIWITANIDKAIEFLWNDNGGIAVASPQSDYDQSLISRAMQANTSLLLKLHGDVDDIDHIVITKDRYDYAYGEQNTVFEKPMSHTLQDAFKNYQMLFLGYSLAQDRTLSVLEQCFQKNSDGLPMRQFAVLQLPAETANSQDPMSPCLYDESENEFSSWRDRRKFISDHNISCIWYPYVSDNNYIHNEALATLFDQLMRDLGIGSTHADENLILFRDKQLSEIVTELKSPGAQVIVTGEPGIGKTSLCRQAVRQYKKEYRSSVFLDIELANVSNLLSFYHHISDKLQYPLPDETTFDSAGERVLQALTQKGISVIYLDNFEDLLNETEPSGSGYEDHSEKSYELNYLWEWFIKLKNHGVSCLISSQVLPPHMVFHAKNIHLCELTWEENEQIPFEKLESVQLFQKLLGREIVSCEQETFHTLIHNLQGHPLAITLTAAQAQTAVNLDELLSVWHTVEQENLNKRHQSLETAVHIAWKSLLLIPKSNFLWGLMAYGTGRLAIKDICCLLEATCGEQDCQNAMSVLLKSGIARVYQNKARDTLEMLIPIREQFFVLSAESGCNLRLECLKCWYDYLQPMLDCANNLQSEQWLVCHTEVLRLLPHIFSIMEHICIDPSAGEEEKNILVFLTSSLNEYYQYSFKSTDLLFSLACYYRRTTGLDRCLAEVFRIRGDLSSRLGNIDTAMQCYTEAELLYKKEQNDLGLANTLKSKGNLSSRLGDIDTAMQCYTGAEVLYKKGKDDLGLADTLQSKGNLFSHLGNIDTAMQCYTEAEVLYKKGKDDLGLADTLKSRGNLSSHLGNIDTAMKCYTEAEVLYKKAHDDLGLANTLQNKGVLSRSLGNIDTAMKCYTEAERIYRKEQYDPGLAITLQNKGDLCSSLGNIDTAMQCYTEAEVLYKKAHDDLKLANILYIKGDLSSHFGDIDTAMQCYTEAEVLYKKKQYDLGLVSTLKSKGDLFSYLGNIDTAMQCYNEAEVLYKKRQDDLGLADTLQSKGNLLSHLGNIDTAMQCYMKAEMLYKKGQDDLGLADTLQSQGDLFNHLGDIDTAMQCYTDAEVLYKKEQDNAGLASTLKSKGDLSSCLGDLDTAMQCYTNAEVLYKKEQDNAGLASALKSKGKLISRLGDLDTAMQCYTEAEGLYKSEQDDLGLACMLQKKGDLLLCLDDLDTAMQCYTEAEVLYKKKKDDFGLANTLLSKGDLSRRLDDLDTAMQCYNEAERLYKKEQDDMGLANTLHSKGNLSRHLGDLDTAMQCYTEAEELYKKEQYIIGLAYIYSELYRCCCQKCMYKQAKKHKKQALKTLKHISGKYESLHTYVMENLS